MLLLEGFFSAQKGRICSHIHSEDECIQLYAECIKIVFNSIFLDDDGGPAQWKLPMNEKGINVGILCLDNNQIQNDLQKFEAFMEASSIDPHQTIKWNNVIPYYQHGMELLC
jgi:hypothetical protein